MATIANIPSNILSNYKESEYNNFHGMNIMSLRYVNMVDELDKYQGNDKSKLYQSIFDAGKALIDIGIVVYDKNKHSYILNTDFGDYDAWHNSADVISENCKLMAKLGHPDFI